VDLALTTVRVLLALVFVVAAVGKLLDLAGSRRAARDFGVPERLAGVVGTALPGVEALIAAGLLVQPAARAAAAAALVLMGLFGVGVLRVLRSGAAPECHCFGAIASEPVGWGTFIRNVVLGLAAAVLLVAGPGGALSALAGDQAFVVVFASASAILALEVVRLRREIAALRDRVSTGASAEAGVPVGTLLPEIELTRLDGTTVGLQRLLEGQMSLLVQVDPGCGPCQEFLPHLVRWRRSLDETVNFLVTSTGSIDPNRGFAERFDLPDLLISEDVRLPNELNLRITPSAVVFDREGRVSEAPAIGSAAIESRLRLLLHEQG